MSEIKFTDSIVSAEWLYENLNAANLIILDASMPNVTANSNQTSQSQIPSARFFDIKSKFSDITAKFPNTYPSDKQFEQEARELGINQNSAIVVYDNKGLYSSPRAWWLFKSFGHHNVAVLNGGLPEWGNRGFPVIVKPQIVNKKGDFESRRNPSFMKFFEDIQSLSASKVYQIIDARSANRFHCNEPEPRVGLRSGTIPNSINLPFDTILDHGKLKSKRELQTTFSKLVNQDKQLVFSCGSGITACVLALAAHVAGYANLSVYDGSWTEYGSLKL